jgi:hypothetical protein
LDRGAPDANGADSARIGVPEQKGHIR